MTYPIAKVYGSRLIHESGLGLNSKVAAVIVNNEWCWPNACLEAMVEVQSACSVVHPLSEDFSVRNLTLDDKFSSRSAWQYLRVKGTKVEWFDLVWVTFPGMVSSLGWLSRID
jgi:hypothetical protein